MSGVLGGLHATLTGVLVGDIVSNASHAPGSSFAEVVCTWSDIAVMLLSVPVPVSHILAMSRWPPHVVSVATVCRGHRDIRWR